MSRPTIQSRPLGGLRGAYEGAHPAVWALAEHAYAAFKRALDVVLVVVSAPIWVPLYGLVAIAILAVDGPPIHYRDRRVGRGGRPVALLKFRSMHVDAAAKLTAMLQRDRAAYEEFATYSKLRSDPRVTRIGGVIRRFSLDELPQLLQVLRGQLSLVGPRPLTWTEIQAAYGERAGELLSVRPGLTGLWQCSGRSNLTLQERAAFDLRYVTERGPLFDIRILASTIPQLLWGSGRDGEAGPTAREHVRALEPTKEEYA